MSVFRWSFLGESDVNLAFSFFMIALFAAVCLLIIRWMFRTGYRLRA